MRTTVFDTPIIKTIFKILALVILKITGWKKEGKIPNVPKFVLIAAPHTSNWDFFYTFLISFAFDLKIFWMGKDAIFKKPFTPIVKWAGGIPVKRSSSNNLVDETIENFNNNEKMVVLIPPEGTRKKVSYWKTGFYYIAKGAHVPIVLAFIDYHRKVAGIGPVITPTGDIKADIEKIQSFYVNVSGKYPEKVGKAEIKRKK